MIIVWGSTCRSYLQKLVSLQNKDLRLITNNFTFHQPFVSVSLLYKQNKILKLSDIYTYEVAMHKFCNKKLPITFSKYFCKTDTVHKLRTRQNLACKFAILRYNHRWAVPRYFLGTGTVSTFVIPVPVPRYFAIFWPYRYFSLGLFFSRD